MPIVRCPKCASRYDPGVDDELAGLDSSVASLKVVCPVCGQWLRLPENEAIEGPPVPREILESMMAQSKLIERGDKVSDDDDEGYQLDEQPRTRADADEDDRPKKKSRARDDDNDEDDRPKKKRRAGDDDDDDEDDRPKRKRRALDDDDDDEDEKNRSSGGSKKKKKTSRPLPGMLLAMAIIAVVWGGLCLLSNCYNVVSAALILRDLFFIPHPLLLEFLGWTKFPATIHFLASLVDLLLSLGIIGGGIALFLRRSFGRHLAIFCPAGMALVLLIDVAVIVITLGRASGVASPVIGGGCCGMIIHLVIAAVFLKMQEDPDLIKALR